jgi:hypothetical protein
LWIIFALLDPDPDPAPQITADPDPKPCYNLSILSPSSHSRKVKPLHDAYMAGVLGSLRDKANEFWGNSYEEAKIDLHK